MYKTIVYFTDLQDMNHVYKVGDVYPREGITVPDSRIASLASENNLQGKPLIEEVEEVVESAEELTEAPKKRGRRKKNVD